MGRVFLPAWGRVACAVLLAALAPWSAARALTPEPLPPGFWWRTGSSGPLGRDPLALLREPGAASFTSEWAPLYREAGGARFERAHRAYRLSSVTRAGAVAAELEEEISTAHGGGGAWWVGADQRLVRRAVLAAGRSFERLDAVAAGGVDANGDPEGGLGVAARPLPGVRLAGDWSCRPERGELEVRWDETSVRAPGRWLEQAVRVSLAGALPRGEVAIALESLDRKPKWVEGRDAIEPSLAWRSAAVSGSARLRRTTLRLALEHGEGRQSLRLRREGAAYGTVAGPIRNDLATASASRGALAASAWAGRWRGNAVGTLALWPFADLTAALGSRRYAVTEATLDHWGIALDRAPAASRWEAGLAAWNLRPRAGYESWQGSLLGLGRDDPSAGETTLSSALLAGVRLAAKAHWGGLAGRLELVQWAPARIVREGNEPGAPGSGGSGSSGGVGGVSGETRITGGTIVRLSLSVSGGPKIGETGR